MLVKQYQTISWKEKSKLMFPLHLNTVFEAKDTFLKFKKASKSYVNYNELIWTITTDVFNLICNLFKQTTSPMEYGFKWSKLNNFASILFVMVHGRLKYRSIIWFLGCYVSAEERKVSEWSSVNL